MLTGSIKPARSRTNSWVYLLAAAAILLCSGQSSNVSAQGQWTTSGTNINNTNSGNVGIGTATPTSALEVQAPDAPITLSQPGVAAKVTLQAALGTDMHLSANAKWTSNVWGRFNTLMPAWNFFLTPSGDYAGIRRAAPGNGAIAWTDLLRVSNTGNVGVGTASPTARVHVVGANGTADSSGAAAPSAFLVTGGIGGAGNWYGGPGGTGGSIDLLGGNGGTPQSGSGAAVGGPGGAINITGGSGGTSAFTASGIGGNVFINGGAMGASSPSGASGNVILANLRGFVGVGTASPAYKFDVAGSIRSSSGGFVFPDGTIQLTAAAGGGSSTTISAANVSAGQFGQNTGAGNFSFPASLLLNGSNSAIVDSSASNRFRICGPNGSCSLAGELIGGRIRLSGTGSFTSAESMFDPGMGGIHAAGNAYIGGSVGIGTTTPNSPLTVSSNTNVTPMLVTGTNANVVGLVVNNSQAGSKAWGLQVTGSGNGYGAANGSLVIRQASDNINSLVVAPSGNIGMGTSAPETKLHVVGDLKVSGNISARYQDVAEWVPSRQQLASGTVVILDSAHDNHVVASSQVYDTRVAGVISPQPGLALGERGEGKVLVATTGRVLVKVDATRAPIRIGDLLVTSNQGGVAMKSEPLNLGGVAIHRPGTIIGKALQSQEKGTGEILVLLSLQ
ncbi:MAG TPA: hypothetical protein VGB76_06120 [Pyrinomonadaceae bacterium]|jgi:hypothetical protein